MRFTVGQTDDQFAQFRLTLRVSCLKQVLVFCSGCQPQGFHARSNDVVGTVRTVIGLTQPRFLVNETTKLLGYGLLHEFSVRNWQSMTPAKGGTFQVAEKVNSRTRDSKCAGKK